MVMDAFHAVLIGVVIGLAAVAGWLAWRSVTLSARVTDAEARSAEGRAAAAEVQRALEHERSERQRERGEAEREVSRLETRVMELTEQVRAGSAELAEVRASFRGEQEKASLERAQMERLLRARAEQMEAERAALEKQYAERLEELSRLSGEKFEAAAARALALSTEEMVKRADQAFADRGRAAAGEIELRKKAVEDLVRPIAETLTRTEAKLAELERSRVGGESAMREQMEVLSRASAELRAETGKLARALSQPQVRGRYGEIQLRRVAELAGMRAYCDFTEQATSVDDEGRVLRPDMVVRLPNGRELAVDAKANLKPYLDALEASSPEESERRLEEFAEGVVRQAQRLGRKGYWTQWEGSPEFVVMFVPGDQFVDAALARRPDLLELAARSNVLLASPSTLIGLLRAVAIGFREQKLTEAAEELRALGMEFHKRAVVAFEHAERLGSALNQAVERFNEFAGSYQKRLEPTLRRFAEQGAGSGREVPELEPLSVRARVNTEGSLPLLDDGQGGAG